jgi:hypothetical protein
MIAADKTVKETFTGITGLIPIADRYPKGAIFVLIILIVLYWPFLWVFDSTKPKPEATPGLKKIEETAGGQLWHFNSRE